MQHRPQSRSIPPVPNRTYPFAPPGPAECEALGRVSAYLRRAGNEVESRALLRTLPCGPPEADLRALHESLRAAAALCDGMAELAAGGGLTRQTHPAWRREATG